MQSHAYTATITPVQHVLRANLMSLCAVSIDTIPHNLLQGIFAQLGTLDLLRCQQACRRWHHCFTNVEVVHELVGHTLSIELYKDSKGNKQHARLADPYIPVSEGGCLQLRLPIGDSNPSHCQWRDSFFMWWHKWSKYVRNLTLQVGEIGCEWPVEHILAIYSLPNKAAGVTLHLKAGKAKTVPRHSTTTADQFFWTRLLAAVVVFEASVATCIMQYANITCAAQGQNS